MGVVQPLNLLKKGNWVLFIIGKELISCNMLAFHENPDRIYNELTPCEMV